MPKLRLPVTVFFMTQSPYVPTSAIPTPHGRDAVDEFVGAVCKLLLITWLFRMIVQRSTFVVATVGVGLVFNPESHVPSCGGGLSLGSEFGPIPTALLRKTEFSITRCPPLFVPEYPSAFRSTSACRTYAWQSRWAPISPDSSPPFHQISLPSSPSRVARSKLRTVRFSIHTPDALSTRIPLPAW